MKPRSGKAKASKAKKSSYHHGDLRDALLAASEKILERDGLQALTLRAAARAVGVSHTAPKNHFDDLTGLLSELAAVGYRRFCVVLDAAAAQCATDPTADRAKEIGKAYVKFAQSHPGLFALMFRSEKLDPNRPALREGIDASIRTIPETSPAKNRVVKPIDIVAVSVARWCVVHGFAVLLAEGRFGSGFLELLPGGVTLDDLLDAVLSSMEAKIERED